MGEQQQPQGQAKKPETTGRRPRGRPKTVSDCARRCEILQVARRLIQESGYSGTTTEMVANAAHISKQTLYRLFPSKAELFRAVVADHRQTLLDLSAARPDMTIAEAIAAIFRVELSPEEERERMAFIDVALQEAAILPEVRAILTEEGPMATMTLLAGWLEDQAADGRIVMEDARSTARMLMDMMFGAMMRPMPLRGKLPEGSERQERLAHIHRCIRTVLQGLLPRG